MPKRHPTFRPPAGRRTARLAIRAVGTAALLLAAAGGLAAYRTFSDLPDLSALAHAAPAQTSYMRLRAAQTGRPASAFRAGTLPLERVSPLLVCAVVKGEDRGFFRHQGVDWAQVRRAVVRTLTGAPMGGSTITQQTARNLYLSPDATLGRKTREVALAREMERTLPKRRILELYLNGVEWGEGVWGADQAAGHYLRTDAGHVDAFGAALLAALLPAPRQPLAGRNLLRAEHVERRVLNQMRASRLLTNTQWLDAQVRTDTFHARLRRGVPPAGALPGPRDGLVTAEGAFRADTVAPFRLDAALSRQCGLAYELGGAR
jgi:monofunctional biosynthetic peptidoglycan transglycosylase